MINIEYCDAFGITSIVRYELEIDAIKMEESLDAAGLFHVRVSDETYKKFLQKIEDELASDDTEI